MVFWAILWFIGQIFFFLNFLIFRSPGRGNLAYRKIVFLHTLNERQYRLASLRRKNARYQRELKAVLQKHEIPLFQERR